MSFSIWHLVSVIKKNPFFFSFSPRIFLESAFWGRYISSITEGSAVIFGSLQCLWFFSYVACVQSACCFGRWCLTTSKYMKFADFCCIFPGTIRGASRSRLHMTVYTRDASSKNKNHKVATIVEDKNRKKNEQNAFSSFRKWLWVKF